MRFAVLMVLAWMASSAEAQVGESFDLRASPAETLMQPLQMRRRGGAETPKVPEGMRSDVFAQGLGSLTDMVIAKDGTVFTSDASGGRVFEITDRYKDGERDSQRVILRDLAAPSGLAVSGKTLWVADSQAVWLYDRDTSSTEVFVSLENANATGSVPLVLDEARGHLWLGLNASGVSYKIITVDLATRRADLKAEGRGQVLDMALAPDGTLWLGLEDRIMPLSMSGLNPDRTVPVEAGARLGGILIMEGQSTPRVLDPWSDHVFVAQGGIARMSKGSSGGLNVVTLPTAFGQPSTQMTVFMDGFVSSSGRLAWGRPGAMAIDSRGMFVADTHGGMVWKISASESPKTPILDIKIYAPDDAVVETAMKDLERRSEERAENPKSKNKFDIGILPRGSQIETASSIAVGSTILERWEAEQASKEDNEDGETSD